MTHLMSSRQPRQLWEGLKRETQHLRLKPLASLMYRTSLWIQATHRPLTWFPTKKEWLATP